MINRNAFFSAIRNSVLFRGFITKPQVDGFNVLLDTAQKTQSDDLRLTAYPLATTYHETARAMQPVREWGLGCGHAYGVPAGPWKQAYYGRGDVQETWLPNYEFADKRLHALGYLRPDQNLAATPDLMLDPAISAVTLFVGMNEGWFTGRRMSEFFTANATDWFDARRIVNGIDCAQQIASYAQIILTALNAKG